MKHTPNILFVMTDHQRADSIGMLQAGREVTPNLNKLASVSAFFARAYSTCPLCVPARTALATGKYPSRNGVVFNDWKGVTAGDHPTLHEILADAGYRVAHVGVHHIRVKPDLRDRVRFSLWVGNREYQRYLAENGIEDDKTETMKPFKKRVIEFADECPISMDYSNPRTGVWGHDARHFKDNFFAREAERFILEAGREPFALFVCFWAPHPPLRVPEPYFSMFPPDRLDLPPNVDMPAEGEPPLRRLGIAAQLAEGCSPEDWRRAWSAHLGLTNLADAAVGRLLKALESTNRTDDSVIIFTDDHGEHLGQHRMYQKMEMYEQAIRVPLIMKFPDSRAHRFETPVSHLDVMPTLLDYLQIEAPRGDGKSLMPRIASGDEPEDGFAFSMFCGNVALGDMRRAVVNRRFKYIHDPIDLPELYDLETDPLETRNLAEDEAHAGVMAELHE
ncbi:MAG: hypothetical protein DRH24_20095, partial [Deltaproteobacteria bacterium]